MKLQFALSYLLLMHLLPVFFLRPSQQQAKTLQQKLAERQKANKARESEGATGPKQGPPSSNTKPKPMDDPDDVIVLE